MHTSTVLTSSDFRYRRLEPGRSVPADFGALFPDYHELDRVGVVSLGLEEGIRQAGGTLLALTTAFYDTQRAKGGPFFNYPQHFALFGEREGQIQTRSGPVLPSSDVLGPSWGNLDVWPESNWHLAAATAEGMLRKVFDLQINRLFWPEQLGTDWPSTRLPHYMERILRARLKAVYYFDTAMPTMEIESTPAAAAVIERSLGSLAVGTGETLDNLPRVERFRQVSASRFVDAMAVCFEDE